MSGRTPAPITICNELAKDGGQDRFRAKVGLPLGDLFLRAEDQVDPGECAGGPREKRKRAKLLFGNMDTWVIWNLTGGPKGGVHVTDVTNASRTMLMNLQTLDWDDEILKLIGIPAAMLPKIMPSSAKFMERLEGSWPAFLLLATWATSRPPCSARPASAPARPRTPTAQAVSCC